MRKTTVLVLGSPSFSRIVGHLFYGRSEFEVVGSSSSLGGLERQGGQFLPELIVVNVKPVSIGIRRVVAAVRRAKPSAKVILSCPVEDLARSARKHGADACLKDEDLADRLLRMARGLSDRPKVVNAGD
jgi:hypothetical protein